MQHVDGVFGGLNAQFALPQGTRQLQAQIQTARHPLDGIGQDAHRFIREAVAQVLLGNRARCQLQFFQLHAAHIRIQLAQARNHVFVIGLLIVSAFKVPDSRFVAL